MPRAGFLNKDQTWLTGFIATEGVKVVKDSASLWPQIVTAISSAGAAPGGCCSHTPFYPQA
ncbi:hypothetical protein ACP0HM_36335 [Escherichia coli]